MQGNLDMLQEELDKGADINDAKISSNGWTPLHNAASYGHSDVCEFLIEHKAAINDVTHVGNTSLMLQCESHCNVKLVELLIDKGGADVNKTDLYGFSALMKAVLSNKPLVVKALLERKADASSRVWIGVHKGQTALDMAKDEGFKEIVDLLSIAPAPPAPPAPMPAFSIPDDSKTESKASTA